jgi:hypothetical protein
MDNLASTAQNHPLRRLIRYNGVGDNLHEASFGVVLVAGEVEACIHATS